MNTEPSPRPWHVGESISGTMSCIYDANGEHIASCFGMPTEADAALIVDAVNQIDNARGISKTAVNEYAELAAENNRLRKEVGRLRYAVKLLDAATGPYCAPELRPRLLAEARAELAEKADAEAAEGERHA